MEQLKEKCKSIIDNHFNVGNSRLDLGDNKFENQSLIGNMLSIVTEESIDECIEFLNTQHSEMSKSFINTGFIKDYIQEKTREFLGL